MTLNKGLLNEVEISNYLNYKKIKELNYEYIEFLEKLYGNLNYDSVVRSWVDYNKFKHDIIISIEGVKKYISIKMGSKNSFHCESLFTFEKFLKECKISDATIKKYKHFHYGYENGVKLSSREFKEIYQKEIDDINKELNNEKFLIKAVNRFVLCGGKDERLKIDGLFVGTIYSFMFFTSNELINLLKFHLSKTSTGVHVSTLFISPFSRCLNNNSKYLPNRDIVQIKWYNIFDDYMLMKMYESIYNEC